MAKTAHKKYRDEIVRILSEHDCKSPDLVADQLARMVPPLYGGIEAADALDVRVSNLAEKPANRAPQGLPKPVARVRASRLWLADDIDRFAVEFRKRRANKAAA